MGEKQTQTPAADLAPENAGVQALGNSRRVARTPPVDMAHENMGLKARVAVLEAEKTQRTADEGLISAKMARGLSRGQAVAVITRQREYDTAKKAAEAKTKTK
jgi:uncharacterized protein YoaH (UPF0181 family)